MWIGAHMFQITFQVMYIVPVYSCLLGCLWIHEVGAITSTLHQKLKFLKNVKLVVVNRETALLISHIPPLVLLKLVKLLLERCSKLYPLMMIVRRLEHPSPHSRMHNR